MPLPMGAHWDDGGKSLDLAFHFYFYNVFDFSCTCLMMNVMICRCGTDETPWFSPRGAESGARRRSPGPSSSRR